MLPLQHPPPRPFSNEQYFRNPRSRIHVQFGLIVCLIFTNAFGYAPINHCWVAISKKSTQIPVFARYANEIGNQNLLSKFGLARSEIQDFFPPPTHRRRIRRRRGLWLKDPQANWRLSLIALFYYSLQLKCSGLGVRERLQTRPIITTPSYVEEQGVEIFPPLWIDNDNEPRALESFRSGLSLLMARISNLVFVVCIYSDEIFSRDQSDNMRLFDETEPSSTMVDETLKGSMNIKPFEAGPSGTIVCVNFWRPRNTARLLNFGENTPQFDQFWYARLSICMNLPQPKKNQWRFIGKVMHIDINLNESYGENISCYEYEKFSCLTNIYLYFVHQLLVNDPLPRVGHVCTCQKIQNQWRCLDKVMHADNNRKEDYERNIMYYGYESVTSLINIHIGFVHKLLESDLLSLVNTVILIPALWIPLRFVKNFLHVEYGDKVTLYLNQSIFSSIYQDTRRINRLHKNVHVIDIELLSSHLELIERNKRYFLSDLCCLENLPNPTNLKTVLNIITILAPAINLSAVPIIYEYDFSTCCKNNYICLSTIIHVQVYLRTSIKTETSLLHGNSKQFESTSWNDRATKYGMQMISAAPSYKHEDRQVCSLGILQTPGKPRSKAEAPQ